MGTNSQIESLEQTAKYGGEVRYPSDLKGLERKGLEQEAVTVQSASFGRLREGAPLGLNIEVGYDSSGLAHTWLTLAAMEDIAGLMDSLGADKPKEMAGKRLMAYHLKSRDLVAVSTEPDVLEKLLAKIVENAGFELTGFGGMISYPRPIDGFEAINKGIAQGLFTISARSYEARHRNNDLSLCMAAAQTKTYRTVPYNILYLLAARYDEHGISSNFPVVNDFDAALRRRGRFFSPAQRSTLTYGQETSEITPDAIRTLDGKNPVGYFVITAENAQEAVEYCKKLSEAAKKAKERSQKGE